MLKRRSYSPKASRSLQTGGDPDIIERKSGGGCLTLFGIPFFLAGLWVLLIGLGTGPAPAAGGFLGSAAAVVVGVIFMTVGGILLRVEEGSGGKRQTIEIPAEELEELEYADRRSALKGIEIPGMKKLKDFGDTGTPRLPDGRPVPKILLTLMRLVPSPGITARSDCVAVNFGKGLPDEELAYLYALTRKILTD